MLGISRGPVSAYDVGEEALSPPSLSLDAASPASRPLPLDLTARIHLKRPASLPAGSNRLKNSPPGGHGSITLVGW